MFNSNATLHAVSPVYSSAQPDTSSLMAQRARTNPWFQQHYDRFNNVAVYASSRTQPGDGFYEHAQKVGQALADAGMGVGTGGGGGSMKAVAEGAVSRGGHTLGFAMPFIGESPSPEVHREMYMYDNFSDRLDNGFERRTAMTAAVPGGIGTLMELTKKMTELHTDKSPYTCQKQIVLFDKNGIYRNFIRYMRENLVANGMMDPKVLDMVKVVDNVDEGVRYLKNNPHCTRGLLA